MLYFHFSVYIKDGSRAVDKIPEPANELFEEDMELYLPDFESS